MFSETEGKESFAAKKLLHYMNTLGDGSESTEFVIQDLMSFVNFMGDGFSKDPYETAYFAGRRSVILYLLSQLEQGEFAVLSRNKLDSVLRKEFASSSDADSVNNSYSNAIFGGEKK